MADVLPGDLEREIDARFDDARLGGLAGQQFFTETVSWLVGLGLDAAQLGHAVTHASERARALPTRFLTAEAVDAAAAICRETGTALRGAPWWAQVTEEWPAPIAHEVARLALVLGGRGAGGDPSPEAALAQLRDVYEVWLKFTALAPVRGLVDASHPEAEPLLRTLFAPLSLGTSWSREVASS
jgi:hypothetical protein